MMRKWAFIVHPRDKYDMMVAYGVSPNELESGRIRGPRVLSEVHEFGAGGVFVVLPLLPKTMYQHPGRARQEILGGVRFAQGLGASIIGLGELTAPFTKKGEWLLDKVSLKTLITTGNTLTAGIVAQEMEEILKDFLPEASVGIVGATGSIGGAVVRLLAEKRKNLLLLARNRVKLSRLVDKVRSVTDAEVIYSTNLQTLKTVDVVVVLTSGAESIIKPENLKVGAIVYDVTQPSNITPNLLEIRPDVTLVRGGFVISSNTKLGVDLRLPPGTVFACLAETMLLAEERLGLSSAQLTGIVEPDLAKFLVAKARNHGFLPAFQMSADRK